MNRWLSAMRLVRISCIAKARCSYAAQAWAFLASVTAQAWRYLASVTAKEHRNSVMEAKAVDALEGPQIIGGGLGVGGEPLLE